MKAFIIQCKESSGFGDYDTCVVGVFLDAEKAEHQMKVMEGEYHWCEFYIEEFEVTE